MKNYLLVLLSVMILGILLTPNLSEADTSNKSEVVNADLANIETMKLPELGDVSELLLEDIADTAAISYRATPAATTYVSASNLATPAADYYVTATSSSVVKNPGANIYHTSKMLYAHNSPDLFGNLASLVVGSTFTVSESGVITTYRVSDKRVFQKIDNTTLYLCYDNNYSDCHGSNQLSQIVNYARYINEDLVRTASHTISMMTCSGTSYGNGDASHRLVIFADKI